MGEKYTPEIFKSRGIAANSFLGRILFWIGHLRENLGYKETLGKILL